MKISYRNTNDGKVCLDRHIDPDMYLLQSALLKKKRSNRRFAMSFFIVMVFTLLIVAYFN